jgi:hypothetical protein
MSGMLETMKELVYMTEEDDDENKEKERSSSEGEGQDISILTQGRAEQSARYLAATTDR